MISSAPSITWLLVTMKPSSEITNPDPKAEDRRWRSPGPLGFWNSRKKSSNGEPSGTMPCGPVRPATVVDVVMFTTDGLICSAKSAKLSGAPRALANTLCARISTIDSDAIQNIWYVCERSCERAMLRSSMRSPSSSKPARLASCHCDVDRCTRATRKG